MTKQSEALRLADALDAHQFDEPHAAAAELRRLHDEITELRHGAGVANQTIADLVAENKMLHERHRDDNVEYTRVLAQRDALLEALKDLMQQYKDQPECFMDWSKARAAIKAAEE